MAMESQRTGNVDPLVVNAAYNFHAHSTSCFGKSCSKLSKCHKINGDNSRKRKRINTCNEECRYRLPRMAKRTTVVQDASPKQIRWYQWDGSYSERCIQEICVKRTMYDSFQNESCSAISESRLTCNTNVSALMPGPNGQYTFKYQLKGTQEEDAIAYTRVMEACRKCLATIKVFDTDRSKVISNMLAASYAHQKSNIIGATLASFITRNGHRFAFSHTTVWCPLKDIESLLTNGPAHTTILHHLGSPFYNCAALNYLCRPTKLETCSVFDFYSVFEVIRATSANRCNLMQFVENGPFRQPSYRQEENSYRYGVRPRYRSFLPKICQYDFPDTADFGGPILDTNTPITPVLEQYAKLVLLLFYHYRNIEDILINDSFTMKLRDVIAKKEIDDFAFWFLQNIQDARSNCFRLQSTKDELQRQTVPFRPADDEFDLFLQELDSDDDANQVFEGQELDDFINRIEQEGDEQTQNDNSNTYLPKTINLSIMRDKGTHKSGYDNLATLRLPTRDTNESVVRLQQQQDYNVIANDNTIEEIRNPIPRRRDLVRVLLKEQDDELTLSKGTAEVKKR